MSEEPTLYIPVPCVRCMTCEECGGSHQKTVESHEMPIPILSVDFSGGGVGGGYRVNGYEANEAAYKLAVVALNR